MALWHYLPVGTGVMMLYAHATRKEWIMTITLKIPPDEGAPLDASHGIATGTMAGTLFWWLLIVIGCCP